MPGSGGGGDSAVKRLGRYELEGPILRWLASDGRVREEIDLRQWERQSVGTHRSVGCTALSLAFMALAITLFIMKESSAAKIAAACAAAFFLLLARGAFRQRGHIALHRGDETRRLPVPVGVSPEEFVIFFASMAAVPGRAGAENTEFAELLGKLKDHLEGKPVREPTKAERKAALARHVDAMKAKAREGPMPAEYVDAVIKGLLVNEGMETLEDEPFDRHPEDDWYHPNALTLNDGRVVFSLTCKDASQLTTAASDLYRSALASIREKRTTGSKVFFAINAESSPRTDASVKVFDACLAECRALSSYSGDVVPAAYEWEAQA